MKDKTRSELAVEQMLAEQSLDGNISFTDDPNEMVIVINKKRWFTLDQACARLGVCRKYIYARAKQGRMDALKVAGITLFRVNY